MYKPEKFEIYELVPPEMMNKSEEELLKLFDENLLIVVDKLRKALGKSITINNWKSGGQYKYSGYRPQQCKIGAPKSAHKRGIALDLKSRA